MIRNKEIILATVLVLAIVLTPLITAKVEVTFSGFLGKIDSNGALTKTIEPVNNYHQITFVCSSENCATVSEKLFESASAGNTIKVTYPTTLESPQGYGTYFFKPGYITWEANVTLAGTDRIAKKIYLSKKEGCSAPISNLVIVNEAEEFIPAVINMTVAIDAKTHAAIQNFGPLAYIPPELKDEYYAVKTRVTLEVLDSDRAIVHTEIQDMIINFSGSTFVSFKWIPQKKGAYTIKVFSDVTDAKCSSSEKQASTGTMEVLEAKPRNICYSLIKSFERDKAFPREDETVVFSYQRISNFADVEAKLFPIKSDIALSFFKEGDLFKSSQTTLPAGQDPTVFIPEQFTEKFPEGNYTAKLKIISNDLKCNGLQNLPTERTMEFKILKKVSDIPPESFFFTIISPENKTYIVSKIPLIVDANRNPGFTYSLNGGPQILLVNPATLNAQQGSNIVEVFAGSENQSKKVTFFVDSIPPQVEIISPEAKTYANGTIGISINTIDANLKRIFFTVNDGPEEPYNAPVFKKFDNGRFVLKAFAEDVLGNKGTDQVAFTVNATQQPPQPPEEPLIFSITSPENKNYKINKIPLIIQTNKKTSFSYSLNGAEKVNFISPTTLNAQQGSNIIEIFAGNQSRKVTFFVDSILPKVEIISPKAKTYIDTRILINISATDENLKKIFFTINDGQKVSYTEPFFKIFSNGNFAIKAFAEDTLGNQGISEIIFTVNKNDTKPPAGGGGGGKVRIAECVPLWKCTDWTTCDTTEKQYRLCQQESQFCERGEVPEMTRACLPAALHIDDLSQKKLNAKQEPVKKTSYTLPFIFLILSIIIEISIILALFLK